MRTERQIYSPNIHIKFLKSPTIGEKSFILIPKTNPMTRTVPTQQIPQALWLSAAERLVAREGRQAAAKRLLASAPTHGIDLDLMWGVIQSDPNPSKNRVRQVTLAVLGSGRTALLFLSNPETSKTLGKPETQTQEISASVHAALDGLKARSPQEVTLAQTLIETDQAWATQACLDAGMISVGKLIYMRMPIGKASKHPDTPPIWPTGITVRPITTIDPNALNTDYHNLIKALETSYEDTLDCPELCGLRSMNDVVDSHSASGDFNPARWHLIFKDNQPAGCCLLSHFPQTNSVELVYLGISPIARGLGLGKSVLAHGINQLGSIGIAEVTCAVDSRNEPAIRIYESLGFESFDARIGFVAPITPESEH